MLFFEGRDTEVFKATRNKLFASNENRFDNHTFLLDMLHWYVSIVYAYYCRGVLKIFLVWLLFFVDICSQKSY